VAASLLVVLALGEVAARLVERADREARAARARPSAERPSGHPGKPVFESMLEIARPNVDGIHNGVPFRTNGDGVRGPEIARRAAPGVTRMLVVGDSVTMGSGVREEEAYAMRVAALVDRPIEPINGGLAGLNAPAVMDRLERLDAIYAPDLLVYGFTINDIEGPDYDPGEDPAAVARLWAKAARHKDARSALIRQLWPRWVMLQERLSPTLGPNENAYVRNALENAAAWAAIESSLDRLARISAAGDRCALVLIHTHLEHLDPVEHVYLPVYEKVEAAARARGLHAVPTFDVFAGRRAKSLWLGFLDPHPSPDGHALLAEALAGGLGALPEACWIDPD
jgi:lysophospholipase L1-like esterase